MYMCNWEFWFEDKFLDFKKIVVVLPGISQEISRHLSPSTIRKPGIVLQIVASGMLAPASIFGYTFVFQDFDFDALEKSTEYDNGLTEGSTLIR